MNLIALGLAGVLQAGLASAAQMPQLNRSGAVPQLYVDGKPYIMLAGELHNSSASSVEYMRPIWARLAALNLNTVIGTVSWELLEPEEGKFDFTLVDAQLREARQRDMRLVLIWFGTWKNATSSYAPIWVKTDTRRFPRVQTKPRPDLESRLTSYFASSVPLPNLSAFGEQTLEADVKAFRRLMQHLREVDPQHTVIMMQVENEAGLLGDSRDRSPLAEAAWSKPVPAGLLNYLTANRAKLLPEMQAVWGVNGFKTSGSWAEVFGTSNQADEVFMAWHVGRYIGKVIEAGKGELAVPMFANAWLGPQTGMEQPGQYPSGGPVARMMDVWRAAAPGADLVAPDIYVPEFKQTCELYARSGNPLFIPEARAIVGNLFWALGHHSALGFSPFGIDNVKEDSQLADAYKVLGPMLPLLAKHQAEGRVIGILMETEKSQTVSFAGYEVTIYSSRAPVRLDAGQAPLESPLSPAPPDTRPYGLMISTAPDEFVIVGSGLSFNFVPNSPGPKIAEVDFMEEGRFERGQWIAGRRLNGDEGRPALRSGPVGVIKLKLYRRD